MTLKELRQALAAKKTAARKALAEFNTLSAVAAPTAEQTARIAALNAELEAAEAEVETMQADLDAKEAQARRTQLFMAGAAAAVVAYGGAARANDPDPIRTHGFKSASEFAVAVRNAQVGRGVDERLGGPVIEGAQPATFNQNQGPGDEGFLAPPEYSQAIWDLAMTDLDILAMTNPEPTSSSAIIKPKDDTTPWGAVGVQARWASEASQYTPSAAKLNGDLMTLQKLFAFVPATDEILQDAPMLRNRLTTQAGRAIAWAASESVMWGTGAGQPTGFMNSPALITVAAAAGENTPTLSVTDLSNMLARVLRRGGRKPVWLVNQDVLPSLIPLSIGNYPVWIPINAGLRETVWDGTIFGYPVMFTEHAQTLGTVGDITLFNPDGYYAVTRQGGVDFAESMHLYFDQGLTAFRWTFRLAGTPYLSKPVSPAKGATTKSHFVALAAR